MSHPSPVLYDADASVAIITINRPTARNAVNPETAHALAEAFRSFNADPAMNVAILTGADGAFCAGVRPQADGGRPSRPSIDAATRPWDRRA